MPGPSIDSRTRSGTASRSPSMMFAARRIQKPPYREASAGRRLEAGRYQPTAPAGASDPTGASAPASRDAGAAVIRAVDEPPPSAAPQREQVGALGETFARQLLQMSS